MAKLFPACAFILTLILTLGLNAAYAESVFGPGTWKAPNGNILTITSIDPSSGQLAGTLVTMSSGKGCQADGKRQPVIGWYDRVSQVLTFSVNWNEEGCHFVVEWSGHYDLATGVIPTLWTRVSQPGGKLLIATGAGEYAPATMP